MSEIKLLSDVGADYKRLRNLLAAGDWLNADNETARLLLMAIGKEEDTFFREQDIEKLPCTDLCIVDQLWRYYSADRFGFSIQSELWKTTSRSNTNADYYTFGILGIQLGWLTDKGWLNYINHQITSDFKEAPKGHFPRWGLGVITFTGEVTWIPGLWGLSALSAKIEGLVRVEWALRQFPVVSPLCTFFSRIETCKLVSTTTNALVAIEQSQELQETIACAFTPELDEVASVDRSFISPSSFNSEILIEIGRFAVDVAKKKLQLRYPSANIEEMPRNNPGYDILLKENDKIIDYVEVKGTKDRKPCFLMTNAERKFSKKYAKQYFLIVVYDINLNTKRYKIAYHRGAVTDSNFILEPRWLCEMR